MWFIFLMNVVRCELPVSGTNKGYLIFKALMFCFGVFRCCFFLFSFITWVWTPWTSSFLSRRTKSQKFVNVKDVHNGLVYSKVELSTENTCVYLILLTYSLHIAIDVLCRKEYSCMMMFHVNKIVLPVTLQYFLTCKRQFTI